MPNVQRTTINLDRDLVTEAAAALGTTRTTDTVHAALREVVAVQARRRLAQRDYDLSLEELHATRHEDPANDLG